MARESIYQSIILKKTPYGEGDEILTVFTRELGKIRLIAKSTKFAKSKLQYSLQSLFMVKITAASKTGIPRVIGVEVLKSFVRIRENLNAANVAFYAIELTMKFTPDEQKNEALYELLAAFLDYLNSAVQDEHLSAGLAKFKIGFLQALGLGVSQTSDLKGQEYIGFSNSLGSFTDQDTPDYVSVRPQAYEQFLLIKDIPFENLHGQNFGDLTQLQNILSDFITYHLERDIKSERFLDL